MGLQSHVIRKKNSITTCGMPINQNASHHQPIKFMMPPLKYLIDFQVLHFSFRCIININKYWPIFLAYFSM